METTKKRRIDDDTLEEFKNVMIIGLVLTLIISPIVEAGIIYIVIWCYNQISDIWTIIAFAGLALVFALAAVLLAVFVIEIIRATIDIIKTCRAKHNKQSKCHK